MEDCYGIRWDKNIVKKLRGADQDPDMFTSLTEHQRVYICSHIYGGAYTNSDKKVAIYKDNKIVIEEVVTPDLLLRFFIEILSNATDNVIKSRVGGLNENFVEIKMTKKTISVKNGGFPIPIAPCKEFTQKGEFGTPVDLFGVIGSGTNLQSDFERHTAGTNGIGAKLTNIFSTKFIVEVGDNIRGVHQRAEWRKNMFEKVSSVCTPPYVKKGKKWVLSDEEEKYTGPNFVKVTYTLDFRKFEQTEYTEQDVNYFKKIAIDASFAVKVPIKFNNEKLDYRDINDVAKLFGGDQYKNRVIIYQFDEKDKEAVKDMEKKDLENKIKFGEITPNVEICMICKPGEGFDTSYTNGVYNKDGGVHTNEAYKVIMDAIKKLSKEDRTLGLTNIDASSLNIKFLKSNAILIMNYKCKDADFDSQMKYKLKKPTPKINLSLENINHIKKWKIFEVIYNKFNQRNKKAINKKRMMFGNFIDANLVGKPGIETELLVCEGNSAGEYVEQYALEVGKIRSAETGRDVNGKDIMAVFELGGKIPNVSGLENQKMDMPEKSGKDNVYVEFMNVMGLTDGVDYETDEGIETLRYKYCDVIVDADNDGSHILCLLINFLYRRFPSFLKAGRLRWIATPIIRAINKRTGATIERFYTQGDYETWKEEHPDIKHEVDYFKGLASASPEQAREDAKKSPNVVLWFDKEADIYINIAFNKKSDSPKQRKEWILRFKEGIEKKIIKSKRRDDEKIFYAKISELLNTKLVEYSLETLPRCIPAFQDQLKHSIRIVTACVLENYNFGNLKTKKAMKFEHLASASAEKFKYHHGGQILYDVMARMAHDFAGSNNLPFLTYESMTGSREHNGQNCGAARYTKGKSNWWVSFLIKKELYEMIPKNIVDGEECEPEWIPFLLPISIINGTKGISTGWSTDIKNYHPLDILVWIHRFISGKKVFPLIPWYIRFFGDISLELRGKRNSEESKGKEGKREKEDNGKNKKRKEYEKEDVENYDIAGDSGDSESSDSENEEEKEEEEKEEEEKEEEEKEEEEGGKKKRAKKSKKPVLILKTEGIYEIKREYTKDIIVEEEDPENYGKMKKVKKTEKFTDFVISEVPIGVTPAKLVKELAKRCDEPPTLRPDNAYTPKIIVSGFKGEFKAEDIGMVTRRKLTNINLLSKDKIPITYDNIYQVLVDYCDNMKKLFEKRKLRTIKELTKEIEQLDQKIFLVGLSNEGKWSFSKKRAEVKKDLHEFKIPYDIFNSIKPDQYTDEGYLELIEKSEKIKEKLQKVKERPAINDWKDHLKTFSEELLNRSEYVKLEKHDYPKVYCDIEDLTSGKILSPYEL